MSIIDISLPIHTRMIIYPNNPKIRIKSVRTKWSYLSEITFGSHTGTHVDAPRHVFKKGVGVDQIDLKKLVGPCRVLDLTQTEDRIKIEDIKKFKIKTGERILAKTKNSLRGYKKFYNDYVWLDPRAATYLANKKIALFGIDYLSIKQRGSSDNRPHTELLKKGIPILEGLDLSGVKPGNYFLVALPLKFTGLDGAPARVVLISGHTGRY